MNGKPFGKEGIKVFAGQSVGRPVYGVGAFVLANFLRLDCLPVLERQKAKQGK